MGAHCTWQNMHYRCPLENRGFAAGAGGCRRPLLSNHSGNEWLLDNCAAVQNSTESFLSIYSAYGLAVPTSTGHYFALIEEMGAGL